MAAQFAAEATLRRVHAAQKDDDMPPIEAILAPLEAELKLARQEVYFSCPRISPLFFSGQITLISVYLCKYVNELYLYPCFSRLRISRTTTELWIASLNQKRPLYWRLTELFKLL